MQFNLSETDLHRLCAVNNFPVPTDRMVFFGIRGCLPVNTSDHAFHPQQSFNLMEVNYTNPRYLQSSLKNQKKNGRWTGKVLSPDALKNRF